MSNPVGRPPKYIDPEQMQKDIDLYFETDAWEGEGDKRIYKPTVSGLAYFLDMATETLRDYQSKDQFSATIKKAKQRVEMHLERRLDGGNAVGTIFNLKNNFGWKDKTEQTIGGDADNPIATKWTVEFINATNEDK